MADFGCKARRSRASFLWTVGDEIVARVHNYESNLELHLTSYSNLSVFDPSNMLHLMGFLKNQAEQVPQAAPEVDKITYNCLIHPLLLAIVTYYEMYPGAGD
jgi:hypothetical protein